MEELEFRHKQARRVTFIGMLINIILVFVKFIFGFFGKSQALIADAVHSLSDFLSDIVILISMRYTKKPADDDHNYGHGKFETLATVMIGLLLIIVGFSLLRENGLIIWNFLFKGATIQSPKFVALYGVFTSIILKEISFYMTIVVAKKTGNESLRANAWHHRSDSISSIAALIGIGIALIFGESFAVFDPIASLVVSLFIMKVGLDIILPGVNQLVEASLSNDELEKIKKMTDSVDGVLNFHDLRTRKIGHYIAIDVHIMVDPDLSIEEAHNIATYLEFDYKHEFGRHTLVVIHIEPYFIDRSPI
ncbi:cation diffusion facilitator family transporter [Haloplasma contractile]|uniref:Cation efflux system protein n=1 Tax=Haloplasma contractile SSD-17B TaxID=1033810 RepID=F7PV94_9MOLU|nr:cation diffusion facilitator family transporter [Haloplasma contractile]ERJ12941.1 Cation efflux system protein [Haloplasma contractile SSD-17B]